jgi:CheY-like chemotaxis protein
MQRILVIDDDPLVRRTMERLLQKSGYEVRLAADGIEGLRAFRTQRPDLVITDIIMPQKEGLDTIACSAPGPRTSRLSPSRAAAALVT